MLEVQGEPALRWAKFNIRKAYIGPTNNRLFFSDFFKETGKAAIITRVTDIAQVRSPFLFGFVLFLFYVLWD